MDGSRFDDLVKQLAGQQSRRRALKSVLAGFAGSAAVAVGLGDAEAARCRAPSQICRKDGDCCSSKCGPANATGRRFCQCVTPADCPTPANGCLEATCTNGVCGTQNACEAEEVCYQNTCCQPVSDEELCEFNCGLETNNCGQSVDCGPCCTEVGEECVDDLECCSGDCVGGLCVCNSDDDCLDGKLCCDGACQSCCFDGDCTPSDVDCKYVECIDGACATFDKDAGDACAENGGTVCDGNGACVECNAASDCPGADTECRTRTCVNNTCGVINAPANTELTNQTVGDCVTVVCDGNGGTQLITDPNDTPTPVNECRDYFCDGDQAESEAKAAGEPCSTGVCDGNGSCVPCITDVTDGVCTTGDLCCDNQCVPNDEENCGTCGFSCSGTDICCVSICVASDELNCGSCGNLCQPNELCCDGACLDTLSNVDNCGLCGFPCGASEECCDGFCVDIFADDPNNCGQCGNVCDSLYYCLAGSCVECIGDFDCAYICVDNVCQDCLPDFEPCLDDFECCSGACFGTCGTP